MMLGTRRRGKRALKKEIDSELKLLGHDLVWYGVAFTRNGRRVDPKTVEFMEREDLTRFKVVTSSPNTRN